jgi:LPPG:FO 2-phospho-L-lactate transferase
MSDGQLNVLLLAGGVGGAKMAEGLNSFSNISLTILGNIADDDSFHGLWVSPDIDTMIYTLSGEINKTQGWGVKNDDYKALSSLRKLGNNTWMSLGDKDIGLHIYRTERLKRGDRASDITKDIAEAFGVKAHIILPTDDVVQTKVLTDQGWLTFQEYVVNL